MSIKSRPVASERIKAKMSLLFIDDLGALRGAELALHCRRCAIDTTRFGKIQRLRGVQLFIGHIHFPHEPSPGGGASILFDECPESPLAAATIPPSHSAGHPDSIIPSAYPEYLMNIFSRSKLYMISKWLAPVSQQSHGSSMSPGGMAKNPKNMPPADASEASICGFIKGLQYQRTAAPLNAWPMKAANT